MTAPVTEDVTMTVPVTEDVTMAAPVTEDVTVAAPVIEDVTVEEIRVPQQQVESQLQPLHTKVFVIKKSKKMIDKNTTLKLQLLQKQRQDVNYKCKVSLYNFVRNIYLYI